MQHDLGERLEGRWCVVLSLGIVLVVVLIGIRLALGIVKTAFVAAGVLALVVLMTHLELLGR